MEEEKKTTKQKRRKSRNRRRRKRNELKKTKAKTTISASLKFAIHNSQGLREDLVKVRFNTPSPLVFWNIESSIFAHDTLSFLTPRCS